MPLLYPLASVEVRFDEERAVTWVEQRWPFCVYASILYVLLVHAGERWMRGKAAWSLRRPLVMWNTSMALFSFLGTLNLLPTMAEAIWHNGIEYSVCQRIVFTTLPRLNLWTFLFVLFKMVELGDTMFVVLRKTPLNFLHWYHHITVMMYCWGLYTYHTMPGAGNWFVVLNYFVHFVMYTYYALKASGYRVPTTIAQLITLLQMSQFVVGIYMNVLAFRLLTAGVDCYLTDQAFYYALGMYGSYFLLFLHFFYKRYIKK